MVVEPKSRCVCSAVLIPQDSFEISKTEQAPGNGDIELGLQGDEITSFAEPGLEGFFEQVAPFFLW